MDSSVPLIAQFSKPTVNTASSGHNTQKKNSLLLPEIAIVPMMRNSTTKNRKLVTKTQSQPHLFLYTQSVPTPKLKDAIRTNRVIIRLFQLVCCSATFIALGFSAFNIDYPFYIRNF